ncbi:carbonic anhydrase [Rickettsiaceae bacterium]|nr:carbonic anhydrase [Rickettsiaceae bacterium]
MNLPSHTKLISFLNNLFDTNTEFVNDHDKAAFVKFKDVQTPKLTILKCSDSRVQMESFDKNPQNGVFAIRNIGNQISTSEGSIDFGIEILETPFLLIIGHSGCGAVEAVVNKQKTNIPAIDKELSTIKLSTSHMEDAIVENVNMQVQHALEKYSSKIKDETLTIIGAIYDFKDDFGFGVGKVVLTNVNGVTDKETINKQYAEQVKNLHCLR